MKKQLLLFFALSSVTLPLLTGCDRRTSAAPSPKAEPAMAVRLVQPKRGAISRSVTLPGELKAFQQATLYAKTAGYLKTIHVDKGESVKQGDLLAEIEAPELIAD